MAEGLNRQASCIHRMHCSRSGRRGQRVQAAVSAPSQVTAQAGLGVLTGGAREPGQVGQRRQPDLIGWRRIGFGGQAASTLPSGRFRTHSGPQADSKASQPDSKASQPDTWHLAKAREAACADGNVGVTAFTRLAANAGIFQCRIGPQINPKLRAPADANADSDLGKRWVRPVGVLATCRRPARHPAVR